MIKINIYLLEGKELKITREARASTKRNEIWQ